MANSQGRSPLSPAQPPRLPNIDKPIDSGGCQNLYRNLLRMPESDAKDVSSSWIREFMTTVRCDAFKNLAERRAAWRSHLGEDAYNNVMNYSQDPIVRERAADTVQHYLFYDRTVLLKCLDWPNWLGYHLFDRPQMTAVWFTVIGGGVATGWKIVKAAKLARDASDIQS